MRSQHVLYTVTGGAVILTWNLGEQAKGDEPKAVASEVFGRHKKRGIGLAPTPRFLLMRCCSV